MSVKCLTRKLDRCGEKLGRDRHEFFPNLTTIIIRSQKKKVHTQKKKKRKKDDASFAGESVWKNDDLFIFDFLILYLCSTRNILFIMNKRFNLTKSENPFPKGESE